MSVKRNVKKKKKEKRLRSLLLLLLLTIIMLGTATYAWFTANQIVTIQALDLQVEASNGLQISTDAVSWKSVITNTDITDNAYSGAVNQVPASVTAVSSDGTISNGRMNMYLGAISNDETTGDYLITSTKQTDTAGAEGYYIAFDVFLKTDTTQQVFLAGTSNVSHKAVTIAGTSEQTTDKGLKNSARVGFVILGHGASTDAVSSLTALNNSGATDAIIWEPNYTSHTSQALIVANEYGVTASTSAATTYRGLNKEFSNGNLKNTVVGTGTEAGYATVMNPAIKTAEGNAANNTFTTLEAGVTKVRIYMWVEGQDIDCENNATGTDISFNVSFTTATS